MYAIGPTYALDGAEERGDGLLHVPFALTAPGVFPYNIDSKRTMVLKPPEEWHSEAFLKSARGVPFTHEHPRGGDVPKKDVLGITDSDPARIGPDGRVIHGATIFDADLIGAIKSRQIRSVSGGYWIDLKAQSGTWKDSKGRAHAYDAVQLNPRVYHVAGVANPRVKNADILLDSEHRAIWCLDWDDPMTIEEILAKLGAIDTAAVDALNALVAAKDSELGTLRKAHDGLRGERDGLLQKLSAAPTLDAIDEQVNARIATLTKVASKTGASIESLANAKDERDMFVAGLTHLKVEFDANESVDYLRGIVDSHAQAPKKSAADALTNQPQVASDLHKSAAARIKAAQEAERKSLRGAQ